jgi:hypothetical protein
VAANIAMGELFEVFEYNGDLSVPDGKDTIMGCGHKSFFHNADLIPVGNLVIPIGNLIERKLKTELDYNEILVQPHQILDVFFVQFKIIE